MTLHDRRSTDHQRGREYAEVEIEDPYDPGSKIVVTRQTRADPLGRLHAHHQIDDCQYNAGRAYQRDWETAERGAQAIDPTREAVDGGRIPEPLTDEQAQARARLIEFRQQLGRRLTLILDVVLLGGQTIEQFTGNGVQSTLKFHGNLFRAGLDELARLYGLSNGEHPANNVAVRQISSYR